MAKEKKIFKQEKKETKIEPKKLVCYKTISL